MLRCCLLAIALTCSFVAGGCASRTGKPVESLSGAEDVSAFTLQTLKGTRDGEKLEVHAVYSDGTRSIAARLRFLVTPPARLTSGEWTGPAGQSGGVTERAVTFLGGQSSGPSIGGRFDLAAPDGRALHRITIPLQELKQTL